MLTETRGESTAQAVALIDVLAELAKGRPVLEGAQPDNEKLRFVLERCPAAEVVTFIRMGGVG